MGRRTTKKTNRKAKGEAGKKNNLMLFLLFIIFILMGILLMIKLWDNEVDSERKILEEEVAAIMEAEKADITIVEDGGYILGPNYMEPSKGIILYSDTGVDPKAYVPLAIRLAKKGYRVVIPEFLFLCSLTDQRNNFTHGDFRCFFQKPFKTIGIFKQGYGD